MNDLSPHARGDALLELRVVEGDLLGACSMVDASQWVRVGSDLLCDVVLPSSASSPLPAALQFRAHSPGMVTVKVEQGSVTVANRPLPFEVETPLPLYTVLRMGTSAIAIGLPDAVDWQHLDEPGTTSPIDTDKTAAPTQAVDKPMAWLHRAAALSRWLIVGGSAAAAMSGGMWAIANTVQPTPPSTEQRAQQLQRELHSAGFTELSVKPASGDEPAAQVVGYLDTLAQQTRLESFLADQTLPTRLELRINESLMTAVLEIFRANNVQATAHTARHGAVTIDTRFADLEALERIKAAALRDVPGLLTLEVRNQRPAPQSAAPVASINDPGKRIESIVQGEMAYVVTADGSRYFEGAFMPTGHRIVSIQKTEVLLEKNGAVLPLHF